MDLKILCEGEEGGKVQVKNDRIIASSVKVSIVPNATSKLQDQEIFDNWQFIM